jgi:hypothetical protein
MDPAMQQFLEAQTQLLQNMTNTVTNLQGQVNNPPVQPPAPRNKHREFMSHHPCRCLNLSTSMGGTRSKVEGEDRHDLEPEGLREDTRHKIYTGSGNWSSYPTSCLEWYCAMRLVLFPGGIVDVWLGTRPSFI